MWRAASHGFPPRSILAPRAFSETTTHFQGDHSPDTVTTDIEAAELPPICDFQHIGSELLNGAGGGRRPTFAVAPQFHKYEREIGIQPSEHRFPLPAVCEAAWNEDQGRTPALAEEERNNSFLSLNPVTGEACQIGTGMVLRRRRTD